MISSSTLFRRILFSNIERLFDSIDDEARDSFDCDSCDCRRDCDDEIRDEIFDDREKDASIMIRMREKSHLRIRRSSNEDDRMIQESD
jgi:hypothetical protein